MNEMIFNNEEEMERGFYGSCSFNFAQIIFALSEKKDQKNTFFDEVPLMNYEQLYVCKQEKTDEKYIENTYYTLFCLN